MKQLLAPNIKMPKKILRSTPFLSKKMSELGTKSKIKRLKLKNKIKILHQKRDATSAKRQQQVQLRPPAARGVSPPPTPSDSNNIESVASVLSSSSRISSLILSNAKSLIHSFPHNSPVRRPLIKALSKGVTSSHFSEEFNINKKTV